MSNTIQIKHSTTASNEPASLATGELAINVADGKIFYGDASEATQTYTPITEGTKVEVKNTSGATITKGTPVYITGAVGGSNRLEIAKADASSSAAMPAIGLLETDLANNAEGYAVQGGFLKGLTTDTIDGSSPSSNDTVYVKAGGGLTMTKPTGSGNEIQNIAKVGRVHASNGSLIVSSILRTNDVPNIAAGKIWVGSSGNTATSSFVHLDESNNRLGLGTSSPQEDIHIQRAAAVGVRLQSTTNSDVEIEFLNNQSNDFSIRNKASNGGLELGRAGGKPYITIGESNSTSKIELSGSVQITGEADIAFEQRDMPLAKNDGEYYGDVVTTLGTGPGGSATNFVAGRLYYFAGDSHWELTDMRNTGSATGMIALAALSGKRKLLVRGFAVQTSWGNLGDTGEELYMGVSGRLQTAKPTGNGQTVRKLGYIVKGGASTCTIWFDPSNDYLTN